MGAPNPVPKFYQSVVEDVVNNVRESFLDESVDEAVLQELKQLWESKMRQSKAVDNMTADQGRQINRYKQQQQQQQQQQEQQQHQTMQAVQCAQTVRIPVTGGAHLQQQQQQQQAVQVQAQLPIYNPASGTLGLSGAAQAATIALPAGLYQQQLAALQDGRFLVQTGQGAPQLIQLVPSQAIAQAQLQAAGGAVTIPMSLVGQQQQIDRKAPTTSQPVIQLDGAQDSKDDDNDTVTPPTAVTDRVRKRPRVKCVLQLDGAHDSSSDDDGDDDDDDDDDDDEDGDDNENNENGNDGPEEDPLNSADDISSEEDPSELFDSENVVVCQFDKINRTKNKWKFTLKDGIMNLNGKDYVFQKMTGEAEW